VDSQTPKQLLFFHIGHFFWLDAQKALLKTTAHMPPTMQAARRAAHSSAPAVLKAGIYIFEHCCN
jgi:hypothetical protein